MDDSTRRQQRNFYMMLSPLDGHEIAEEEAGFVAPAEDSLEHEIRDVLKLWLTLQQSDAGTIIANCAWWMTQYMDPERKMDAEEGVTHLDKLTSFAVSVLGLLIKDEIVELKVDPELPDIKISTEGLFDSSQLDFLKNLERLMEEGDDD
jgi:hypothetical protein